MDGRCNFLQQKAMIIQDEKIYPKETKWNRLKKLLRCTYCPPNQHENQKRKAQYGKKIGHGNSEIKNRNNI